MPVAILSAPGFDAPSAVDRASLIFGRTGDEAGLAFSDRRAKDVNGDGLRDLICHFHTGRTGFQLGDSQGILKGLTVDVISIEGADLVQILTTPSETP